jgi:hypothetical protein
MYSLWLKWNLAGLYVLWLLLVNADYRVKRNPRILIRITPVSSVHDIYKFLVVEEVKFMVLVVERYEILRLLIGCLRDLPEFKIFYFFVVEHEAAIENLGYELYD